MSKLAKRKVLARGCGMREEYAARTSLGTTLVLTEEELQWCLERSLREHAEVEGAKVVRHGPAVALFKEGWLVAAIDPKTWRLEPRCEQAELHRERAELVKRLNRALAHVEQHLRRTA